MMLRRMSRKLTKMLLCVITALGILLFPYFFPKTIHGNFRSRMGYYMRSEVTDFLQLTSSSKERLLLIDKNLLAAYHDLKLRANLDNFTVVENANFHGVVTFALVWPEDKIEQYKIVLPILRLWDADFLLERISYTAYTKFHPHQKDLPLGFILRESKGIVVIEVVLFHERQGSYLWHGSLQQDQHYLTKLKNLQTSEKTMNNLVLTKQGAFDKFIFETHEVEGRLLSVPKDIPRFLNESSHFIECNYEMADRFFKANGRDKTDEALKEVHRMTEVLSRAKAVLNGMGIPFWLSSGTLLGYYRQCDMIPYGRDVDIEIFKKDCPQALVKAMVKAMQAAHLKLFRVYGRHNDSLEITFSYSGMRVDIFFIYDDGTNFYNAAHVLSSRKGKIVLPGSTYKFIFPKFTLCWTEFLGMKVRVPCETESVISAVYGPNWEKPVTKWSFYKSPFNSKLMYNWTQAQNTRLARTFY